MGVKWEADVSMAGCQGGTALSRKERGEEKEGKKIIKNPWWRLGCQDLNGGDT